MNSLVQFGCANRIAPRYLDRMLEMLAMVPRTAALERRRALSFVIFTLLKVSGVDYRQPGSA
jgi:hypothetical protein